IPFITMILSLSLNGTAWKNKNNDDPSRATTSWESYSRDNHYATHDWIAEIALMKIKNDPKWITKDGQEFWTDKRITIYLFGTEGPDFSDIIFYDFKGLPIIGMGDPTFHSVRFDNTTQAYIKMDIRDALNGITDVLNGKKTQKKEWEGLTTVLAKGDCDAAAFYMGMLSHYIADLGCFPHTISMDNAHHANYEIKIAERTDCAVGLKHNTFTESARYECFHINLAFPLKTLITSPTALALKLAYDTRFGAKTTRGECDAEWMEGMLYNINWINIDDDSWRYWAHNDNEYKFLNRVEKSLQHSVEAVANALNWVIDTHLKYHKELECKCSEGETNTKSKSRQRFLTDYLFYFMWLEVGMFAALYTFAVALTPLKPA
ncbi:MAG: hypothetical protein ACFFC3_06025, partial [Candidatus Odinarchaeota archaeon]